MNVERVKNSEIAQLQARSALSLVNEPEMPAEEVKKYLSFFMNLGAESPLVALINRVIGQINEGRQILSGVGEPGLQTQGYIGQLYKQTDSNPAAYWICTGVGDFGCEWDRILTRDLERIEKISSVGLVDTYEICFSDGTRTTFEVTNGNSIEEIVKTGTNGLTDTYGIHYKNGSVTVYQIKNGRGIVSITKTGAEGLVDTYTVAFNDGTTGEFTVTNGDSSAANEAAQIALQASASANGAAQRTENAISNAASAAAGASAAAQDADAAADEATAAAARADGAAANANSAASAANEAAANRGYITCQVIDEALYFTYHNITGVQFVLNSLDEMEVVYSV